MTRKKIAMTANQILPQDSLVYKYLMLCFLYVTYQFRMRKQKSIIIELPINGQCNLNCKGCLSFAPLAKSHHKYDLEVFKHDILRLAKINKGQGKIKFLALSGGEPLLNPEINEYIKFARQSFPDIKLKIRTNGLLVPQMPDEFWDTCKEHNIEFMLPHYSAVDIKLSKNIIRNHGLNIGVPITGNTRKQMYYFPLSDKKSDKSYYKICPQVNSGHVTILNGKSYNCMPIAFVDILNENFNLNFQTTAQDSIDIHSISDINSIIDFATKPTPFCKYCDYKNSKFGVRWGLSTHQISEWVR
ncbi:MAG: radical SAM protein [Alphaproteobacteria bacterium]|nr:radical SAM protein [Alphaproteobacteria bacterium]